MPFGAHKSACRIVQSTTTRCDDQGMRVKRTVETPLVGDIIHQQDAHGAAIVGGGDGAEALLARGVPYLQLDSLAVELDGADLEVDAEGGDEGGGEGVLAEAQQAAGLAHA